MVTDGDILKGFHCTGYDVEVLYINEYSDGSKQAIGRCGNPDCRDKCGCGHRGCPYDGIVSIDDVDHPELFAL